jgi:hypothetical protein
MKFKSEAQLPIKSRIKLTIKVYKNKTYKLPSKIISSTITQNLKKISSMFIRGFKCINLSEYYVY